MKIISIFALGILLGAVLGFIIFMNTPLSSRYEMIYAEKGFLIKYNTWDGKASLRNLAPEMGRSMYREVGRSMYQEVWIPISDKQEENDEFDELFEDIVAIPPKEEEEFEEEEEAFKDIP